MDGNTYRLISMAWRNIWRNKRRTLITISAVVFAVSIAVFSWCIALGEHEQMINDALKLFPGHIQVHARGYWEDKTIYNSFKPSEELIATLSADERVRAVTMRLSVDSLISSDTNTSGVVLVGVDPKTEFSEIRNKIVEGEFLAPGDTRSIVVGESLARNLNVSIGDELVILTQAYDGSIGAQIFTVSGVFRGGSQEFDRGLALVNLEAADYLLSMYGLVTELTVMLKENRFTDEVAEEMARGLDPEAYEVMPWEELIPDLVQFVELDNVFGYIYYVMILIVVIFGIMNTILMAVMERYREFGVMMALGTKPERIVSLILTESAMIALVGIAVGNLLGFAVSYYYTQVPIDLSAYSKSMESFGINPLLYARIYPFVFYVTDVIVLAATLLSAVYPAVKASRLSPVRALRYV
jgi:ABC-type lipoprotein release transport system permease subunit